MNRSVRLPPGTIDAHVHIGRDTYGPSATYERVMDRLGSSAAVLVARQWQFDNDELMAAAREAGQRFRVVAAVDLAAPGAARGLDQLIDAGIVGIRVDPAWLPSTPDAIWSRLETAEIVVSVAPRAETIAGAAFARAISRRRCSIRLEHLGGIRPMQMDRTDGRRRAIIALAAWPMVSMMWSGLWLNAGSPRPYHTAHGLLDEVIGEFGPERVCWSGDWNRPSPPVGAHISETDYAAEAELVVKLAGTSAATILGGTARQLFRMDGSPAS